MNKTLLLLLGLFTCFSGFGQDFTTAIEKARFLIHHHQQHTQVPGVQVAVMVGDSLVWSEGFGYSNLERELRVEETTQFRIASVSKSVTSVALGKLMEQGKIDLDRDVRFYVPDFPEKEYVITPRQLAASTAGIRHYTDRDPETNSVHYPNVTASLERFQDDPLLFEPGTDFHYSSYGWVLLSAAMEKAANESFFQLMEDTWDDLGMKHTAFDHPNEETPSVSEFYIYDKKKGRVLAPEDDRSYMYAGGGYLSTAKDLAHSGSNLIQNEYLDEKTVNELFRSQRLTDSTKTHYGLGWEMGMSRMGTRVVYHGGSMPSARSHLILYPNEEVVFVYLANTGDHIFFNEREAQTIAEIFVEAKNNGPTVENIPELTGKWDVSTTSLRDQKTGGTLQLDIERGCVAGELEFKRSKKKKKFPVVVTSYHDGVAHLVAVSPMYIDLFLTVSDTSFDGRWLHDFNVNGVPEEDEYWKPRKIKGKKVDSD